MSIIYDYRAPDPESEFEDDWEHCPYCECVLQDDAYCPICDKLIYCTGNCGCDGRMHCMAEIKD